MRAWDTGETTYVLEFEEGALVLDFVEPQTGVRLFSGVVKLEVRRELEEDQRRTRIDGVIRLLFERFPRAE